MKKCYFIFVITLISIIMFLCSCSETENITDILPQSPEVDDYVTEISILKEPNKTVFAYNEKPSFSGLKVLVTYNSGKTKTITKGFEINYTTPLSAHLPQSVKVTVSYEGKETGFNVNCIDTVKKIEIIKLPDKTEYQIGESPDLAGLTIKATYFSGKTETYTNPKEKNKQKVHCIAYQPFDNGGEKVVRVHYAADAYAEFNVTVIQTEEQNEN